MRFSKWTFLYIVFYYNFLSFSEITKNISFLGTCWISCGALLFPSPKDHMTYDLPDICVVLDTFQEKWKTTQNLWKLSQGCCGAPGVPGQGCGAREAERANVHLNPAADDGWFGRDDCPLHDFDGLAWLLPATWEPATCHLGQVQSPSAPSWHLSSAAQTYLSLRDMEGREAMVTNIDESTEIGFQVSCHLTSTANYKYKCKCKYKYI